MKLLTFKISILITVSSGLFTGAAEARIRGENPDITTPIARTSCISDLVDRGVTRIGAYDLRVLENEVTSVTVIENPYDTIEVSEPLTKFVAINPLKDNEHFEEWEILLLHKSLLALGYDDQDYQISTGLCWLEKRTLLVENIKGHEENGYSVQNYSSQPQFAALQTIKRIRRLTAPASTGRWVPTLKFELLSKYSMLAAIRKEKGNAIADRTTTEQAIMNARFMVAPKSQLVSEIKKDSTGAYIVPEDLYLVNESDSLQGLLLKAFLQDTPRKSRYNISDITSEATRTLCVKNTITKGTRRLGEMDLENLMRELKNVTVVIDDNAERGSGGLRKSGVNFPGSGFVSIRTPRQDELNHNWDLILLHESLGALGYNDEHYALSTSLCWTGQKEIDTTPFEGLAATQFKSLKKTNQPRLYPSYTWKKGANGKMSLESGGATSTGGGGDIFASVVKKDMLSWSLALEELRKTTGHIPQSRKGLTPQEIEKAILDARIEQFNDNPDVTEIQVTKGVEGKPIYWIPKSLHLRQENGVMAYVGELLLHQITLDLRAAKGLQ